MALDSLLRTTPPYDAIAGDRLAALIAAIGAATEGSFLFARRFLDTLRAALARQAGQATLDIVALLRNPARLDETLADAYAEVVAQLRRTLAQAPNAADEAVLAVLAVVFAPLAAPLLVALSGHEPTAVAASLVRLNSVLAPQAAAAGAPVYALYSRSFGDYLRLTLPEQGRGWDRKVADVLETFAAGGDAAAARYQASFRWRHLQRGLQLVSSAPATADAAPAALPVTSLAALQAQVPDPLLRARVLRSQAVALLDPGSLRQHAWTTAVQVLEWAEQGLRRSRALVPFGQGRHLHFDSRQLTPASAAALAELERTLLARGDVYTMIATQLLGTDELRPTPPGGLALWLVTAWSTLLRLPMLAYMWWPLRRSGVTGREFWASVLHVGRGIDWSVTRLLVRAAMTYRAAGRIAERRGDLTSSEEITDRLGQLYARLGIQHAAARVFSNLLAGPTTLERPWQEALWRLRLGEVLVAQDQLTRATPLLESAWRQFAGQDAPRPLARVSTALVQLHLRQAELLRGGGNDRDAASYEDTALRYAETGIAAWDRLTTLDGDELTNVDPALGRSRLAGYVWRLQENPRIAEEQQRRAANLLATITERHYPLRFEHPALLLFRVSALVIVPLLLVVGLLFAVQLPSGIQLVPRSSATFQPPLVNTEGFPDNLLVNSQVQGSDLVQTITSLNSAAALRAAAPPLDNGRLFWVLLPRGGALLTLYMLIGLSFILLSDPISFQQARPGRLVLRRDGLTLRGLPRSNQHWRIWLVLLQELWGALYRWVLRRPAALSVAASAAAAEPQLTWSEIKRVLIIERRVNRRALYDLSKRVLVPVDSAQPVVVISGSVARYDELTTEIERLSNVSHRRVASELLLSFMGGLFVWTMGWAVGLLLLIMALPSVLRLRPGGGPFHLSELYILIMPGLSLPLFWWFVFQPLHALVAQHPLQRRSLLGVLAVFVGGVALAGLPFLGYDLSLVGLNPDLVMPLGSMGAFATVVALVHQRAGYAGGSAARQYRRTVSAALLVALPSFLGVANLVREGLWYTDQVFGNRLVEQALTTPACDGGQGCPLLSQASARYAAMVRWRPNNSDGYSAGGFAALLAGDSAAARERFTAALDRVPPLHAGTRRKLQASLGEVAAREARGATDPAAVAVAFDQALARYRDVLGAGADGPIEIHDHNGQYRLKGEQRRPAVCLAAGRCLV